MQAIQLTQRIYVELSKENIGYTGLLYNPTGSEIIKQTNGGIITTRNIRWYLILLFLVVLITIPLTMLKHVLRRGRSDVASG